MRLSILLLAIAALPAAADTAFVSPERKAVLLELYTSEGCSSCPPADRWLSTLLDSPALFESVVPVAFHVDYWDDLGWRDRFAAPEFSARQRAHAGARRVSGVYTPGFVRDGREWRQWFSGARDVAADEATAGVLALEVYADEIAVSFQPAGTTEALHVEIALLGFGLESRVLRGENTGRRLTHDFVVLDWQSQPLSRRAGAYSARAPRPESAHRPQRLALAAWVSEAPGGAPLQAVGGFLD